MWRLNIKHHFKALVRPLLFGVLLLSGHAQTLIQGTITYISKDNAYMDMGKKKGVAIGDTIEVYRSDKLLGKAVVSQTSGSSSALRQVDTLSTGWQIGDLVQMEIEDTQPLLSVQTVAADSVQTETAPRVVKLDSLAFQARQPSKPEIEGNRLLPNFSGYLSARVDDRGGDPESPRRTSTSLYGQFQMLDLGIKHLDASVYFRGGKSSQDSVFDSQIYSVMFEYKKPGSPFDLSFGRIYHHMFSTLGSVDGIGLSWRLGQFTLGMLGGSVPSNNVYPDMVKRRRLGVMGQQQFSWGDVMLGMNAEVTPDGLSRNYLASEARYRAFRSFRVRVQGEFDLDIQDQSPTQSLISLTRFSSSLNGRLGRHFISNLRYSYRENVMDLLDTAETEYDLAARHSANGSVSWYHSSGLNLSTQASFRTDGDGKAIQTYGLTLNKRDLGGWEMDFMSGVMAMNSYLSQGGRIYLSVSRRMLPWLDIDIYDEIFAYKILGDDQTRVRHRPELSLKAKLPYMERIRLRTRFEQEDGVTFYRLSLSISRQF
jgi:hypothetical protein